MFRDPILLTLILSFFSPLVFLFVHIIFSRSCRSSPNQMIAIYAVGSGILFLTLFLVFGIINQTEFASQQEKIGLFFYGTILFIAVGYFYFHLFNTSETARRIRIMQEIHHSGFLTKADIVTLYSEKHMVEVRLARLVSLKQLILKNESYFLHRSLLYYAALFVWFWRFIIGLEKKQTEKS